MNIEELQFGHSQAETEANRLQDDLNTLRNSDVVTIVDETRELLGKNAPQLEIEHSSSPSEKPETTDVMKAYEIFSYFISKVIEPQLFAEQENIKKAIQKTLTSSILPDENVEFFQEAA